MSEAHTARVMLCLMPSDRKGGREVREGEGLKGEQELREKVHLHSQLSGWAVSFMGLCPDASEEVQAGRMPIYPHSMQCKK